MDLLPQPPLLALFLIQYLVSTLQQLHGLVSQLLLECLMRPLLQQDLLHLFLRHLHHFLPLQLCKHQVFILYLVCIFSPLLLSHCLHQYPLVEVFLHPVLFKVLPLSLILYLLLLYLLCLLVGLRHCQETSLAVSQFNSQD